MEWKGLSFLLCLSGVYLSEWTPVCCVTFYSRGETIVLRCPLAPSTTTVTQFLKKHLEIVRDDTVAGFQGPWVISNNSVIAPALRKATTRYSVVGSRHVYTLKIQDARPEDSGTWACRTLHEMGYGETELDNILVAGPMRWVSWRTNGRIPYDYFDSLPPDGLPDGATFNVSMTSPPNTFCDVISTNLEPDVTITIGNIHEPDSINLTSKFKKYSDIHAELDTRGFVNVTERIGFRPHSKQVFEPHHNGRELHCRAVHPRTGQVMDQYAILNIEAPPLDVTCDGMHPTFDLGTKDAKITCVVRGNPLPEVRWQLPDNTMVTSSVSGYHVINEYMEGDRLNTTLVISDVKESDFAQFTVVVRNQHGSDAYAVSVTSGSVGSVGRPPTPWLISSVVFVIGAIIVAT